jgi:uncharacterized 2Fe-2S/4Fe-4S cluster protein (DUF4445 family)
VSRKVVVHLKPLGSAVQLPAGSALADALVAFGVEFPCGGRGRCRGCRVRVLEGTLPATDADRARLSEAELAGGWRLVCQARPEADLVIELRQWSGLILADETPFPFTPVEGLGIAVDVGTTTVVAQLLDLTNGRILATETNINPQARFGADVMSRISAGCAPGGREKLTSAIREAVAAMVVRLLAKGGSAEPVRRGAIVGNTAMHHLFLGHDVAPLASYPFRTPNLGEGRMKGGDIGWSGAAADAGACFLPNLGGFVGSDILGVILATRIHESPVFVGSADLGTNGEIVFGGASGIVVSSTAAGPAFEGARISQGMRAAPGAVDRVTIHAGALMAHVIGGVKPQGICGSGLVDAVACGLASGAIAPSGRMEAGEMPVVGKVKLKQSDVRELQLAKGAIAAGIQILMKQSGKEASDVATFFLAGAFGNSLDVANARRIGLLPFPLETVKPVGNAALLGAKLALFAPDGGKPLFDSVTGKCRHVSLEQDAEFQDLFADLMGF